ncbi:MAG: B12-binding domain-containing radical SAM protein [Deltaproteobacteria bacterium]|nr:B12-binding domain-containing radical SAM protein [Deltaproteobacteria bacterium]MBW1927534.1 B12-binding domain-containing radical SAM protein [Deltaproteobacteria bacterium]MBW2026538.1 B12-binding domain-containing radical SAM protein [Deltaproteobacteria bacterium]MBW2125195.1 B12-binding domain-containing radical SAM protein [Deltaproteobacteria bacterium]
MSITKVKERHWNKYRVWKPLSLLVLAGLTPPEWDITVIDENLGVPEYAAMPRPDLVGITAFTSQANRAYEVAAEFRSRGVLVVIGGIHATMCLAEASERVDAVVTGEAESIWAEVLKDAQQGALSRVYTGTRGEMANVPLARHDLLPTYCLGSIQTARGCPLNCSFCSVTAFNGRLLRRRPIEDVVQEFKLIQEKYVLIVDDNLIGTRKNHISGTKELFRAMIQANIRKKWIAQVTINMADDEELLSLAAKAGCLGVFIGLESPTVEGLMEVDKGFNIQKGRDFKASVQRIQEHGILVAGSFIIGLDVDKKGIGKQIADTANHCGLDALNVLFLTPLPGTRLWEKMESEDRIAANVFPEDWKYYTLAFPVAKYRHLSWADMLNEMETCCQAFYSYQRILRRVLFNLWHMRRPINTLVSNLSLKSSHCGFDREIYQGLNLSRGKAQCENVKHSSPLIKIFD